MLGFSKTSPSQYGLHCSGAVTVKGTGCWALSLRTVLLKTIKTKPIDIMKMKDSSHGTSVGKWLTISMRTKSQGVDQLNYNV